MVCHDNIIHDSKVATKSNNELQFSVAAFLLNTKSVTFTCYATPITGRQERGWQEQGRRKAGRVLDLLQCFINRMEDCARVCYKRGQGSQKRLNRR